MDKCRHFERCSAPLCPVDEMIRRRLWYVGEPVCKNPFYTKLGWIRKQRTIQRKKIIFWLNRSIELPELIEASRPRQMTFLELDITSRSG